MQPTPRTRCSIHYNIHIAARPHIAGHELILLHESLVLAVEVKHLADALGCHLCLLGAGEGVVVAGHICHDGALVRLDSGVDVCARRQGGIKHSTSTVRTARFPRCYRWLTVRPSSDSPSASSIRGMSKCFSATSKARLRFSRSLLFFRLS